MSTKAAIEGRAASREVGVLAKYFRVIRYALAEWRTLTIIIVLTLLLSMFAAIQPLPLKILVDYGLGDALIAGPILASFAALNLEPTRTAFVLLAAVMGIVIFAVGAILEAGLTIGWATAGQRMIYGLATDLFLRLQRLSLIFHSKRTVGDSLTRITGDAWSVHVVTDSLLIAPARDLMMIGSVGAVAWHLNRDLSLLLLVVVPLMVGSAVYFGERLRQTARVNREAVAKLTAFVQQVLGAIPLVQAFAAGPRNLDIFRRLSGETVHSNVSMTVVNNVYGIINGTATTIGLALIIFAGGRMVLAGELSVGSLLVLVAYARSLETASRGLLATFGTLRRAEASIDRVLEILDSTEAVYDLAGAKPLPERDRRGAGRIVFDRVTFGYVPGTTVLKELSLEVAPGETLALVGSTGSGKSTLASLVPRFFDPWQGRVLLDGMDIRGLRLSCLRDEVALVLQEPFILPISVAENIAYGRLGANRDDIVAAAVAANAHGFIQELPQGYDTVLGDEGASLSGGQRQRIAIARALLKDARVLILDEPTSALDVGTEKSVLDALGRLMAGRTTLVIAHRLATVQHADRIAVIEEGHIVELGAHAQLLAAGGPYAKLYGLLLQSGLAEDAP